LRESEGTAPGQPTIEELTALYRFRSITPATKVYGVVGWPVGHSKSPAVHNAGFEAVGHDGVYLPLPIPPEWEHFKATVTSLIEDEHLDLAGLSITIPHKAHALRLAHELGWSIDPFAASAGAANTITIDANRNVRVSNTDGTAARACLEDAIAGGLAGKRIAILGAGGVARGIAAALATSGAQLTVFNRSTDRAASLASDLAKNLTEGTTIEAMSLAAIDETQQIGRAHV